MADAPEQPRAVDALLDQMWRDYTSMNPQAQQIYDLFAARGEQVKNDHIALRTFDLPEVNIDVLARPFLASGYRFGGHYEFTGKRLIAHHYEPPQPTLPKVFISQLLVHELPRQAAQLVTQLVAGIDREATERFDFCCSGRPWSVSFEEYSQLRELSEYGAWLAAIGFRPNHFTVLVNELERTPSIEQVNELLEAQGFLLNSSGGKIKGSPDTLLEQSSVLANNIDVEFSDGVHRVPGCYYEFARRYAQPDGSLFTGFIAGSADRIFESTDRGQ